MMELTAKNVQEVFFICMFDDAGTEDRSNAVIVEGIVSKFGFHPGRLEANKPVIAELLDQLPDEFKGGWSFLNACMTKAGVHWGEHNHIEMLLALGIGTGQARIIMPRAQWKLFPGGMPYFSVSPQPELLKLKEAKA